MVDHALRLEAELSALKIAFSFFLGHYVMRNSKTPESAQQWMKDFTAATLAQIENTEIRMEDGDTSSEEIREIMMEYVEKNFGSIKFSTRFN